MLATSQKLLSKPQAAEIITILVASAQQEDHETLQLIFDHRNWRILKAETCAETRKVLRETKVAAVISDRDLPDGSWKEVLYELALMKAPPQLIVASRLADDHLWAEVLNLGGFDVLQKPFEPSEVMRAVSMAWRQHSGSPARPLLPQFSDGRFEPHSFPITYSAN